MFVLSIYCRKVSRKDYSCLRLRHFGEIRLPILQKNNFLTLKKLFFGKLWNVICIIRQYMIVSKSTLFSIERTLRSIKILYKVWVLCALTIVLEIILVLIRTVTLRLLLLFCYQNWLCLRILIGMSSYSFFLS